MRVHRFLHSWLQGKPTPKQDSGRIVLRSGNELDESASFFTLLVIIFIMSPSKPGLYLGC